MDESLDNFHIDSWDKISQEKLIEKLTVIIEDWIEKRPEELFGKLYRLDILEQDIKVAIQTDNPCKSIATLILERQYQKYLSRKNFHNPPASEEDEDMLW